MIALVVHGGAGAIATERHARVADGCAAAAAAGYAVLAAGGAALDAVQAAVRVLEDDPELNAGTGAVLTRQGTVELDAAIMDGASLGVGAVAAVPDLARPVDLARAVLDDGEHVLLAGPAAWLFARERGFAPAPPWALITDRARARWQLERERRTGPDDERDGGTVGAVALDRHGHVAAATSTGGINYKRPGRVGDTPLPGAGTWADDLAGAASATGDGEAIIRVGLTRGLCDRLARGETADAAAGAVIAELARRGRGHGGVICVDPRGGLAAVHDTATMAFAAVRDDGHGVRRAAGVSTHGYRLADLLAT
ncbi:MAG TPA: isoaspartyl peptidase/L-asparaginase [Kofleriaceae bacterium]|nr:isoaspartyl peptidase/L-asparaginase [Kofleriaceae bacterium]